MTLEGTSFDGYRLLRLLGYGGAGEVYLAMSPVDGPRAPQVAIKIFRDARRNPVTVDLMRAAHRVAALHHPQILPCYGDARQGNDLGIVMELAQGGSLGDTLDGGDSSLTLPLRPDVTVQIINQVARTLADIHARGLVHGNLKPTNLFLRNASGGPVVSISDFGHAFLARAAVATIRQDVSGQPPEWAIMQLSWAAPEQMDGDATPASDQYGLAALAYYLLAGIRPISPEAQIILNSRAPNPLAPPSRLNPALDDNVDAVLLRALSPLRGQRFGDVREFARALSNALLAGNGGEGGAPTHATLARAQATRRVAPRRPPRPRKASSMSDTGDRPAKRPLARMDYSAPSAAIRRTAIVVDDDDLPDSSPDGAAPARPRRRAIIFSAVGVLLVAFVLGMLIFNTGVARLIGSNGATTAQSSPTPVSIAERQAESRLQAALAKQPAYSDKLTGTPANWAVNGKSVFFGPDQQLHLLNTANTPLFADMPADAPIPKGAYVATVDVTLVKGKTSDHAGMRFLISASSQGDTYYSYLVTPDARFEVWRQQPGTGLVFLTSGYVASLKTGIGQVNTLAVLIDPTTNMLTLFANGAFVYQAPVGKGVALTGRLGVLTPDSGVEAAFSRFAMYSA